MTRKQPRRAPPAKAGAATLKTATARLKHEVRHERPMCDWGRGETGKRKGGDR